MDNIPNTNGTQRHVVLNRAASHELARTRWGEEARARVAGSETDGQYAILDYSGPEHFGPPRHIHHREDEIFHVVEGTAVLWSPDGTNIVGPGDVVALPKGVPHTWRSFGSGRMRLAVTVVPSGFEHYFPQIAASGLELSDIDGLTKLAAGMGIEVVGPPLTDAEVEAALRSAGHNVKGKEQ
jgi:mannose-6-phosphate isomerase-like protein (cupin superfamily)